MWLGWVWSKGDSIVEKRLRYTNRRYWNRVIHLEDQNGALKAENDALKSTLVLITRIGETDTTNPVEGLRLAHQMAKQTLTMAQHYYEKDDE